MYLVTIVVLTRLLNVIIVITNPVLYVLTIMAVIIENVKSIPVPINYVMNVKFVTKI